MARTEKNRGKGKVKEISNALLNSEIPEIQAIINELTERTKKLEEHSKKLQTYAAKIQELSGEEIELLRWDFEPCTRCGERRGFFFEFQFHAFGSQFTDRAKTISVVFGDHDAIAIDRPRRGEINIAHVGGFDTFCWACGDRFPFPLR